MDVKKINANTPEVKELGVIDYVNSDGTLIRQSPCSAVMVRTSSDLSDLIGIVAPGSIAFTAGGGDKWQLSAAGTWETWG